ncbi:glycine--tRNA ligase subunit beta [Erythrobacter sp. MTPC3]|uniref:glycine--tRNA ligase subunit beta n=1 Tax=Erythrobacter sp. MTPC3 TaxID=3056564 RepID=UPI0036F284D5
MADFLLELRSEEIPARMQKGARGELEKLFRREMDAAGVAVGDLSVWSTPRRLALIARGLPTETEAVRDEAKGPPVGAPDQAVDGFCRKNGVTRDQLEEREVKGRATYFAVIEKPGQPVAELLAAAIPAIIDDFSWPKSMRWGDASISSESLRWVRPLSGIVALLDGEVVSCITHGLASGRETMGHRFHSDGVISIDGADDYAAKLRLASVIVDHKEREDMIRTGAKDAAQSAGLALVEDEGLVIENAGLTEWPVPLLGRFDEDYLDVPPEVIQLTARVNQKYFVCEDAANDGQNRLANAFICTANIAATHPEVVVDGNRKVLAARLSDARFFWELDQKKTLAQHAEGLERITFHEKLGTVADKVDRVAKLARWLCEEDVVKGNPDLAEQAARLCKADLVTEMVGEFPELQGLMGGYYAETEDLPIEVSDAIRDHYKPVGQGDDVPTAPVTVAVSLADKLDTLASFFEIEEFPTGSKDPYALRRAAIGVLTLVRQNGLKIHLGEVLGQGWLGHSKKRELSQSEFSRRKIMTSVPDFLLDRLKIVLKDAGIRHDFVAASTNWGTSDDGRIDRVEKRAGALQSFVLSEDGQNLLAGYKRAANILKKEDWDTSAGDGIEHTGEEDPLALAGKPEFDAVVAATAESNSLSYSPEPAEKALIDALDAAAPKAAAAVNAEEFETAMAALATLRGPIDAFFEDVTVNDDDPEKREARLDLLSRFTKAVGNVADFSRIEG